MSELSQLSPAGRCQDPNHHSIPLCCRGWDRSRAEQAHGMAAGVFSQALGHVPAQELYYSISSAFIQLVLCPITGGTAKCICGTRLLIFMP